MSIIREYHGMCLATNVLGFTTWCATARMLTHGNAQLCVYCECSITNANIHGDHLRKIDTQLQAI
ncbi:uncharacterized protein PHALS_15087 [Plasmopara halstedii]|uniref:Uncharacterized protein n=1 Tax=Plasmopara halstedii TaxID=4781 RepID=A0A0P1AZV5_PLAHL|nr:uncharacterized protein PHALS_15087 [Plasmopara halstedii]CEG47908.1 hypothetical protein PHALS_15087 [Plasmopara halstedii]|eukprot:XP_024584277.1 hypothetical protein PHALS_15087 [Plasmopara halstedii]